MIIGMAEHRASSTRAGTPTGSTLFLGVMLLLAVLAQHAGPRAYAEARCTTTDDAAHLLETERRRQVLRQRHRAEGHLDDGRRRRGHLRARRQRRRQVDASSRSSPACTSPTRASCSSTASEVHVRTRRATRWTRGIATVYQDLAMVPLMSIWRNFFLGAEPTQGLGPFRRFDVGDGASGSPATELARDGHRHPRPRPAGRHAVRRRAAVGGDRARRLLRRPGADPRRADLGARRQAGRRRAAVHRCRRATAASASSSSPTTRTTPTRSATASCCSTAAGASATSPRARSTATSSSS